MGNDTLGWDNWVTLDGFAHPDSPAGGGGPGRFRIPGPLGLHDAPYALPHPQAPAARHMDLEGAARAAGAQSQIEKFVSDVVGAETLQRLKVVAELSLGKETFGLGVCAGIIKNLASGLLEMGELAKTFVLADFYERLENPGRPRWIDALPGLGSGLLSMPTVLSGLMALGGLTKEDLRKAHDESEQIKKELGHVMAHPLDYLSSLPETIRKDYADRWNHFQTLNQTAGLQARFEAGVAFGDLLADVLLTVAGLATGAGTAVRAASKIPQLVKAARVATRGAKGATAAAKVSKTAGAAETAITTTRVERRIPVSGPRLKGKPDGAPHNQQWKSINVEPGSFKAERAKALDPENLSPSDADAWDKLERQDYPESKIKEILNSGEDFRPREFTKDEPMYAFESANYKGKDCDSPYWMDSETFAAMEKQFKHGDVWDRQGVKAKLALPCFNTADGIVQGKISETHLGVESTVGRATENLTYTAADGTIVPGAKTLPGGGKQVTPGLGKVIPIGK